MSAPEGNWSPDDGTSNTPLVAFARAPVTRGARIPRTELRDHSSLDRPSTVSPATLERFRAERSVRSGSSLGTEGLTADDGSRVAGGEERLFFERSIGCCVIFVGREEPELLEMTHDAALDAREDAFDLSVFEGLQGVESRGGARARGLEDAVEDKGVEMDMEIEGRPKALHHDHRTWADSVETSVARTTS